ncbi:hypothetical protein [Komagataeibacter oboediens]|uniref:hypothetical protein n=1 Tax=Komagataeibacter oboediens TaxID=65958 RepID=UPI0012F51095|nr:hypothetical protein [Komagataeibacter oboediens]
MMLATVTRPTKPFNWENGAPTSGQSAYDRGWDFPVTQYDAYRRQLHSEPSIPTPMTHHERVGRLKADSFRETRWTKQSLARRMREKRDRVRYRPKGDQALLKACKEILH